MVLNVKQHSIGVSLGVVVLILEWFISGLLLRWAFTVKHYIHELKVIKLLTERPGVEFSNITKV